MTISWSDFYFPPINLFSLPKQYKDYKMLKDNDLRGTYNINEETNVKPQWILKEARANDRQVGGDHYKKMGIEPWDVMQLVLTEEEFVGYLKGNIIKYAIRDGKKIGAEKDGEKALHHKQKLSEIKKENETW
jgi:hypothetical protein